MENNYNFKKIKMILIAVTIIFFLLTISVFLFNKNKNYNATKNELLTQTNTWKTEQEIEDEYYLSIIRELQETNKYIPALETEIKEIEAQIRRYRLTRRCLEYELERIQTNKGYVVWFCNNPDTLEQFTNENKQTEIVKQQANNFEVQQVVF